MPDGMNFVLPEDSFSRLKQQADAALANGDEERCIELIEQIYKMLDAELSMGRAVPRDTR